MKIKIPQAFPQFENNPSLFIIAGQFEVNFLVAKNGEMEEKEPIQFSMREEGKDKQTYQHGNPAPQSMGALSHFGAYRRDLIDKVHREARDRVYNLIDTENIEDIYVFAPDYAIQGIVENLKPRARGKIKEEFHGEYTKMSPIELLEMLQEKTETVLFEAQSEEEQNILEKPTTGTRLKI